MKKLLLLGTILLASLLQAQTTPQHHVDLSWSTPSNIPTGAGSVTGYKVYRIQADCSNGTVGMTVIATITSATQFAFSDTTVTQTPLANGTFYCYAITATGPGGESSFSPILLAGITPFPNPPNPPSNFILKPI